MLRVYHTLQSPAKSHQTKTGLPSATEVSAIVNRLVDASVPLAYWAGYTKVVLISAAHIRPWTVCPSGTGGRNVMLFPRRWIDITGKKISDVWEAALRAVLGIIVLRPGVSQVCIALVMPIVTYADAVHRPKFAGD